MQHHEAQRNGIIFAGALVGALLLGLVMIFGQSYFQRVRVETEYRQYLSVTDPDLKRLRVEENAALENYTWVDEGEGRVRIPIERAMALVVAESSRRDQNR